MRKVILGFALLFLGTLSLQAQERDRDRIQDQDRTKLAMVDGVMLQLRDRAEMRLQEKQVLNDGTEVFPNGTYVTRDGKKFRLKDGECLDGDGILYRNEYQYRYKINQENKGLTQEQIRERHQNRIQYANVDGTMYLIRNQEQNRLENQLQLSDGTVVHPDGSIMMQNRDRVQLRDGECINMDGEVFRNMYQHRKMMLQQKMTPAKNMLKKTMNKPVTVNQKKIG